MTYPRWMQVALVVGLALVASRARAECDPGGRCCDDTACCSDGRDNDEDGRLDCEDPSCNGIPPCVASEDCANGADDDGDGRVDCEDPDCAAAPPCVTGGPETSCADGEDNDEDGRADCDDSDCAGDPACATESDCADGRDDDGDGLTDCEDSRDCSDDPACREGDCRNGLDDDADGLTDCADVDCHGRDCCPARERCDNLVDDDFDGLIDCEDVDACIDADACALPPEDCADGRDDDRDGLTDCEDPQCVRFRDCPPPVSPLEPLVLEASSRRIACLWPPSHDVRCVDVSDIDVEIRGACGEASLVLVSCMSSQPEDGTGDGAFEPDCVIEDGRACFRAERAGDDAAGRTYTLVAIAVDALGRTSEPVPVGIVVVPRDGREALRCGLDPGVLLPPRQPSLPRRTR